MRTLATWRASALLAAALLAGCTVAGAQTGGGSLGPGVAQASIVVQPDGDRRWQADRPVIVSVTDGTLERVRVVGPHGDSVAGHTVANQTVWRSTPPLLQFGTRYRVDAVAVDQYGLRTHVRTMFRTARPDHLVHASVQVADGAVVGVGMPLIVLFDAPVVNRAAAEERMTVTTDRAVVGSWYWVGPQQARWRPREYWPEHTDVDVDIDLSGVRLGPNTWGDDREHVSYAIGDAMVSTVDIAEHTLTVTRNGQKLRTIPITTGKPGWDTRNGIKVIISKDLHVVMDAATLDVPKDDPEYYRLDVEYAMRLTWSGEYLHAAPWSVASQGVENVSHGCTGMSMEDAAWLYSVSKPGDVVEYVNGVRPLEPWNGFTDWNMSWAQWKSGSALK